MTGLIATNCTFDGQSDIYRGEVRDVYTVDNKLISVATDRLSVFGHTFNQPVPNKGQILNLLTYYFAHETSDIIPNWIEYCPDPQVLVGKRCQRININMVIRGSLVGHAWRIYEAGIRTICGVELPDGMQQYDIFNEPIITPTTKASSGYEEDISGGDIVAEGLMSESDYERLCIVSRQLFIRGKQMAREKGLMLADTKYEFGYYDGELYLIDEIHTPDTSRYFYLDQYENYLITRTSQLEHLSKEYARQWLLEQGYSGMDDQIVPTITNDFIKTLALQYQIVYKRLTGQQVVKLDHNSDQRINMAVNGLLVKKNPL